MSKSYTPGLKVLEYCKVEKERILPLKGQVLVDSDSKVKSTDIVASTKIPGNVHMINIANKLNIDPDYVPKVMKVSLEQSVKSGEVIAESKGMFGMFKSEVTSPIDGYISQISDITGQIVISEESIPININAYISGKINGIIDDEGVFVEGYGTYIQGIIGLGGEEQGELLVLSDKNKIDSVDEKNKDKILVIPGFITYDLYQKYKKIGVKGIIAGGFDYKSMSKILGYSLGVAITGSEKTLTLVVTEGFGNIDMSEKTYNLLKKYSGKHASINGTTQIRAGVIRPEVFIHDTSSKSGGSSFNEDDLIISIGSNVRIIRQPFFGKLGKVVNLPNNLEKMESETLVRVAEVQLGDGSKKIIPRANLEVILSDKNS
tara:strand:- start:1411 stop:2532 length:1122 start_codon:yes stop_codon:yes gene_type:complete